MNKLLNYFKLDLVSLYMWHVCAHVVFIYFVIYGTFSQWIIALGLYLVQATIGGTIVYHRLLSHKSFVSPKWFEYIGTLIGSLGGNGSGLAWAAVHREHHRYTDTEKDPHCPHHKGFFDTQFLTFTHTPKLKYVPDLLRSKFHVKVHEYYWLINLTYVLLIMSIDVNAVLYAYFVPALLTWHAGSLINTIGHMFGYKNYETKDTSVNNFFTGYMVSGEGWHNNHHADPKNPKFGRKWYELDIGYQIIKLVRVNK